MTIPSKNSQFYNKLDFLLKNEKLYPLYVQIYIYNLYKKKVTKCPYIIHDTKQDDFKLHCYDFNKDEAASQLTTWNEKNLFKYIHTEYKKILLYGDLLNTVPYSINLPHSILMCINVSNFSKSWLNLYTV